MAQKVFDTYHAPEEETEGVKQALDRENIPWFETHKGRWWIGSAALWINEDNDYAKAREAIDEFQAEWRTRAQESARHSPGTPAFDLSHWKRLPVAVVVIGIVLYFSLFWFWL